MPDRLDDFVHFPAQCLSDQTQGEAFDRLGGHVRREGQCVAINEHVHHDYAVPRAKLREETVKIANVLMEKSANALRCTKEAIRAVRDMNHDQAYQYLASKLQALQSVDKEGPAKGIAQFIDDKSYRPGFGSYKP